MLAVVQSLMLSYFTDRRYHSIYLNYSCMTKKLKEKKYIRRGKLPEIGFDCIISCQNTRYFYFQNLAVKVVDSLKSALCSKVFINYFHFDQSLEVFKSR